MWSSGRMETFARLIFARKRPLALRALAVTLLFTALLAPWGAASADSPASAGEAIYRRGIVGSGAPLEARRSGGMRTLGAAAACVNCHRRSGFGGKEGRSIIPPITGRYLFRPRPTEGNDREIPFVPGMRGDREPYTDATLARAIRAGLDSEGKPLSYLMPRFALNDADMSALIGYLKRLDHRRVPGVTEKTLDFATIITPDADPVKRRGMLEVLEKFFADRNSRQMKAVPRVRAQGHSALMFMVHRQWQLHVWELTGAEATWQEQLERHLAREPVFAVVSGLGGSTWAPVHAFCEKAALPCFFPNVEVPVDSERDFYPVYFSKGVLLEAELIATALLDASRGAMPKTVRQVYRAGDSGEAAAQALAAALKPHAISVSNRVLPRGAAGEGVAEALRGSAAADALVLWLRPADVAALGTAPAAPATVFM